jgi:hypothetical protein
MEDFWGDRGESKQVKHQIKNDFCTKPKSMDVEGLKDHGPTILLQ